MDKRLTENKMSKAIRRLGNVIRNLLLGLISPKIKHGNNFHFQLSCKISTRVELIKCGDSVGIGANNLFMCNVKFGNNIITAPNVMFLNKSEHNFKLIGKDLFHCGWGEMGLINVEDDVWLGCSSIILGPCIIGRGSIVAAGAVVTKDVPPYSIVGGNPAKIIGYRFTQKEIEEHERLIK